MQAVLCKAWGDPSTLVLEDVRSPALESGVKVRVHACGVNFADTLMIAGQYQVKPPLPFSPGLEVAGEIIEIAPGETSRKVGQRVIAICNYGGLAEEVVLPAAMTFPIPDNMDYETAAAFPIAYGTSHVALEHRGKLKEGETLLVLGAAGGVGLTAVEIGKVMGAKVIAAASSTEKLHVARQAGADELIDYSKENLRDRVREVTNGAGVDVIYDPVGGDLFDQAMRCIAWEGRLLVIGFASGRIPQLPVNLTLVKNCSVVGVYWGAYASNNPQVLAESLKTLFKWYAEGKLHPHISHTFPIEQTAEAYYMLINRQSTGKVVITVP
jgi:NADPH2:quinone reductase